MSLTMFMLQGAAGMLFMRLANITVSTWTPATNQYIRSAIHFHLCSETNNSGFSVQ